MSVPRVPAVVRFWPKVNQDGAVPAHRPDLGCCWLWTAGTDGYGYGAFNWRPDNGATFRIEAHRWSYQDACGPIPDGLELDHLCRVPQCVNPAHLEPVTHRENILRGEAPSAKWARRTHCSSGHELAGGNIRTEQNRGRRCRTCAHRNEAARWARRKAAIATPTSEEAA